MRSCYPRKFTMKFLGFAAVSLIGFFWRVEVSQQIKLPFAHNPRMPLLEVLGERNPFVSAGIIRPDARVVDILTVSRITQVLDSIVCSYRIFMVNLTFRPFTFFIKPS